MPYGTAAGTRFTELPIENLEAFLSEESNRDAYPTSYKLVSEAVAELKPVTEAEKTEDELLAELEAEEAEATEDKAKKKKK